jgi:HD-GYP domain-containing protein (c-di-GMP phosphodiesterase class II)
MIMEFPGLYIYDEYSEYEDLTEILDEKTRLEAMNALKTMNIDRVLYLSTEITEQLLSVEDLMIDFKDLKFYHNDTYAHSLNVAMLATTCGIGLGMNNYDLQELCASAMLHDIGKRGINREILDKPGKLTPEEREIINQHPAIGYNMMYDNPAITTRARMGILLHHENWDGTGYPRGIHGDRIPLYARIIHVADVYDAMCQKRAYKEDYDPKECVEYLMANSGTMFDLHIVDNFIHYLTIYPVGTDVMLSTGQKARVIKNRAKSVLRPVVMLEDKTILDLAKDRNTYNITIVGYDKVFLEGKDLEPAEESVESAEAEELAEVE